MRNHDINSYPFLPSSNKVVRTLFRNIAIANKPPTTEHSYIRKVYQGCQSGFISTATPPMLY